MPIGWGLISLACLVPIGWLLANFDATARAGLGTVVASWSAASPSSC
jgi:hypothetical protein